MAAELKINVVLTSTAKKEPNWLGHCIQQPLRTLELLKWLLENQDDALTYSLMINQVTPQERYKTYTMIIKEAHIT
jgi:hypothetical protein